MLRLLAFLACLALAAPAAAQAAASNSPTEISDGFFRTLQAAGAEKAYATLFAGSLMSKKQGDVEYLTSQTTAVLKYFGGVVGWELIRENQVSPSYAQRTYLLRLEGGPTFFRFDFYRGPTNWSVAYVNFTDQYSKVPN